MMHNRLREIQDRLKLACERAGRDPSSVRLLAVSKGHSAEKIKEAYALGVRDFGENYANEMATKVEATTASCPEIRWHFIGHIQSNKLKQIAQAHWIHSLSEVRHAHALVQLNNQNRVLMQVNLEDSDHRSGVPESEALKSYAQLREILGDRLCGLMTIAPLKPGVDASFWFAKMKALRDQTMPELSMGMSTDFEKAIAFGATVIRIGTLLFGERERTPKH